ncbi:MAG: DMT family transporter [Bacillus sp. (in: firmicutes)]
MQGPKINPYLVLMIGVAAVSTSAIFVKLATAPAGVIAFYRLFFTVVLMSPFVFLKNREEIGAVRKKDWIFIIWAGVFLAFHFILWFESLNYTSVASSTVLVTMQPLFAFLGAYFFFRESVTLKAVAYALLAIIGSVIISWGDFRISGMALYGDFLALAACALITGYLLFGQNVRKRINLMTYTFLVYSVSALILLMYVMARREPLWGYPAGDWIWFFLLAVLPTLMGHSLFNWSIKYIGTTTISMAILLEPVGAAIMAYYILGEKIWGTQILGGTVVMMGVLLYLLEEKRRKRKQMKWTDPGHTTNGEG